MATVLIVDDDADFTSALAQFLRLQGHASAAAASLEAARAELAQQMPDVLILDLMLPDGNGFELLAEFSAARPQKIIIATGHSGIQALIGDVAGEDVQYMKKPVEPRDIIAVLNALAVDAPVAEDPSAYFGLLIGESPAMQAVYEKIRQVGPTDSTVLIQGESGTGKELVAEAIHLASGRKGAFVPVNCGGLTKDLVASQLFGHEKGSFTGATRKHEGFFERANGGTLFLDEITEMPADMQTHLLRVLETERVLRVGAEQEIPVDARLLAATNRNPGAAVREERLREDLYFRLRVFPIILPPLRERGADLMVLARHFLDELNTRHATNRELADGSDVALTRHGWPGNVRELKHTVHRAYIMARGDEVDMVAALEDELPADVEGLRVGRSIADVERDLIIATLEQLDGDKKAAAASLGISLKTLYNRLKDYEKAGSESEL